MQIRPNIYNVGAGGNNAYLITGEKIALIDTVLKDFADDLITNIEQITPVTKIDYLICNHTEQNKSGAVGPLLEKNPDIEVIATVAGLRNLKEMLNRGFNEQVAKDDAILDLGNGLSLKFLITPNINWPDSMVTYEESTRTLFSCDLMSEGEEYLFPDFTSNALERIAKLDIDLICTGKGNKAAPVAETEQADSGVVILYSSRYGATEKMAKTIKEALENTETHLLCAGDNCDFSELIHNSSALIVGTQTENNGSDKLLLGKIAALTPLKMRHKPFFTFGSYGWSGEGPQIVHNLLKSYGMRPFSKPFLSIFTLSEEKRKELISHTQKFAEFIQC
ncbi:MAG: FprA family A-type flavoprotein [Clostridia bacterium]|nr:FprA family A-type flavoprotein [Clostridia bacterium]